MWDGLKHILSIIFLIVALPYVILILLNGRQGIGVSVKLPDLEYRVLERLLQEDLSWMEDGTVRLLAVLYRTEEENNSSSGYMDDAAASIVGTEYDRAYQAVKETAGQILKIAGQDARIPYHMLSAGRTRDGRILGNDYAYLQEVDCPKDLTAENYLSVFRIPKEELRAALGNGFCMEKVQLEYDESGYVLAVVCEEKVWQGEEFRRRLHLPSDCFAMEPEGDSLRIVAKGIGHGFGISLYTANEKIREGMSFMEILEQFYQDISCITIP